MSSSWAPRIQHRHRQVRFVRRAHNMAQRQGNAEENLSQLLNEQARVEELSDSPDSKSKRTPNEDAQSRGLPSSSKQIHDTNHLLPPWLEPASIDILQDDLITKTSETQQKTQSDCIPFLTLEDTQDFLLNSHGLPHLNKQGHSAFLYKVFQPMPAPYQVVDASRPWFFYWSLMGLSTLGEDVSAYGERLVQTLQPLQNPTGGFGGGHGQYSHCATSYGCILSLAMTGKLDTVDRKSMWHWLGQVKQADGGFRMAVMAEEDIRGAYCAMIIITLLNLPLDLPPDAPARKHGLTSFLDLLGEWVGRCQTYEGGIAGAPNNEAHGAYAFCALGCLSIIDAPHRSISKYLDVNALLSWLAGTQTSPEGGFAGRTNKLVDACYSHWVGGCWALLEAALSGSQAQNKDHVLWNRQGLIRYLLTCCQQPGKKAGMRDKPSARPDAYHTSYSLAGLSAATNHYTFEEKEAQRDQSGRLTAAFQWSATAASSDERDEWKIDADDAVAFVHPVFVIPFEAVQTARSQFQDRRESF